MTAEHSEYQKKLRLFHEHVAAARRSAELLAVYHGKLLPLYPLKPDNVEHLDSEQTMPVYALFKKYEQLIVLLNDNILKHIPYFDLENVGRMSRFDTIIYAEKAGILQSAQRFVDAVALRNQLAHEYPLDSSKQASLINAVIVETEVLLRVFAQLTSYIASRAPMWAATRAASPTDVA